MRTTSISLHACARRSVVFGVLVVAVGCTGGGGGGGASPASGVQAPGASRPADPARSTVTVDRSGGVLADGRDAAEVLVTLLDASGKPIPDARVELSADGGASCDDPATPTGADGTARGKIHSSVGGAHAITATGVSGSSRVVLAAHPTVTFDAVFPAAGSLLALPSVRITADGTSAASLAVTAVGPGGQALPGVQVTLEATGTANVLTQPGPTDGSGMATGTLVSTRAEAKTITATLTLNGHSITLSGTVTFAPGPIDPALSSVAVTPAAGAVADGFATAAIHVQLQDAHANPIPDALVSVAATGAQNLLVQPAGPTDALGVADATIASLRAEAKTISVTAGAASLAAHPTVTFVLPSPRYALVASRTDASVAVYSVDAASGQLRTRTSARAGTSPHALALDARGRFAFVLDATSTVTALALDANGVLRTAGTATAGTAPAAMALSRAGFAYVANGGSSDVSAFRADPETGLLTPVGTLATGTSPAAIALDPAGRFAFTANQGSNDVSAFSIDATTGALTLVGSVAAGTGPRALAIDPSGRFLYAANATSNDVSAFSIDATTGALSPLGAVVAGTAPQAIAVDALARFAYVANQGSNDVSAFAMGPTGALTLVGTVLSGGTGPADLRIDPSARFVYVANAASDVVSELAIGPSGALSLARTMRTQASPAALVLSGGAALVDQTLRVAATNRTSNTLSSFPVAANGTLGPAVTLTTGTQPRGQALDPLGRFLFVANVGDGTIATYLIDATGSLTAGPLTVATGAGTIGLAVDPSGRFLVAANGISNDVSSYAISATGALTPIGLPIAAGTGPASVCIHPTGKWVYVPSELSPDVASYSLDPATGALASLGPLLNLGLTGLAVNVAVEPSGRFAYAGNAFIDPVTLLGPNTIFRFTIGANGALALAAETPSGGATTFDIAVHPSGRFAYSVDLGSNTLSSYSIDEATGALTVLAGVLPLGTAPEKVSLSRDGRFAWVSCRRTGTVEGIAIDPATGAATLNGTAAAGLQPRHVMAIDRTR